MSICSDNEKFCQSIVFTWRQIQAIGAKDYFAALNIGVKRLAKRLDGLDNDRIPARNTAPPCIQWS